MDFPTAKAFAALLVLGAVGGCGEAMPEPGPFEATGEIIALSGGDAGARGACVTCHGLDGGGNGMLAPRLAGLDAGYIARQLEFYDAGLRRDPQMEWIAGRLDNAARMKLGAYYASLPVPEQARAQPAPCSPEIAALYHEGDPARGLASCASCHGEDGEGAGRGNPPLADQPAAYLEQQLRRWRSGERYGDPGGAMTRISRLLREDELAPLSGYSARLTDGRNRRALREACLRTHRPDPRNGA